MAKTRSGNRGDGRNLLKAARSRSLKARKEAETARRAARAASEGAKQAKDAVTEARKRRVRRKLAKGPRRQMLDARDVAQGITIDDTVEKANETTKAANAIAKIAWAEAREARNHASNIAEEVRTCVATLDKQPTAEYTCSTQPS